MDRDPRVLNLRPLFAAPVRKKTKEEDEKSDWPGDLFHFGVLVTLVCLGVVVVKLYWGYQ